MYFVGQSTILTLTGNRATGEAYTLAHHLTIDGGKRSLMIAALRYWFTVLKWQPPSLCSMTVLILATTCLFPATCERIRSRSLPCAWLFSE